MDDQNNISAELAQRLRDCEGDRQLLINELAPMFRQLWSEALRCIETALPDFREPASADAKLHTALRSRILNEGNRQIRELPSILKNYVLTQVFEREVVTRLRAGGHGPHDLPAGVVMPCSAAVAS